MATRAKRAVLQRDAAALQRVIAVVNGKGGVLKTTLVTNIGGLLAASGYKVLIVDLDHQSNVGEDLGYTGSDIDDEGLNLAQALAFGAELVPTQGVRPGLDVAVGGIHLLVAVAALEKKSATDPVGAKLGLATVLAPIADRYDVILLDCPPGDRGLQTPGAAAARWLLIPAKPDSASRKGMNSVLSLVDSVAEDNPDVDLLGVVLTEIDKGATAVQRNARQGIVDAFGGSTDVLFEDFVRHSITTAVQAREEGRLVHEVAQSVRNGPKWWEVIRGEAPRPTLRAGAADSVADDLMGITQELVRRITAAETKGAES